MAGMVVARARAEFAAARSGLAAPTGAVFTMGALHAGHEALLAGARDASATLVATIFLNPTQFGPGEDLARYPRPIERDLDCCAAAGVDLVWVPAVDDVYRAGLPQVTIDPGALGAELEGASRPGHFTGVLTVVAKLLHLTRPQRAYFGEKDYQQLTLIRRMVADLDIDTEIVGVPTVREPDGLALSSRNAYLDATERRTATALFRALTASANQLGPAKAVLDVAQHVLDEAGVDVDYLALRGTDLGPAPPSGPARLLVAARFGTTRLIDNSPVRLE